MKANGFGGSLDALIGQVSSGKVDIRTIALLSLISEFTAALESNHDKELDSLSRFVSEMAILLRYKCRYILGKDSEEDLELEDISTAEEKEVLLISLLGATVFREVSIELERKLQETSLTVPRSVGPDLSLVAEIKDPLRKISPMQLRDTFERILHVVEREVVDASHITSVPVSVREVGETVMRRLLSQSEVTFTDLVLFAKSRFEIVVSFLLILEGSRVGFLELEMVEGTEKDLVLVRISREASQSAAEVFAEIFRVIE
ncbi:condensin subunit ScpA [Ferrithrix thermotolerans DSM 19514]|uniref:Segregation and condensation protein A n=1 Tax=Ferrithrix thermotolerans DSM 19514 TaxID=1121881 RepID=A0A1M4W2V5_9ACTN|nr:segregation/condensation protein A [Ferrithrix thermotolerans]SHE75601.1 condensin subunit ScpA [Ferrithrix thermotolerans DSM 19514]